MGFHRSPPTLVATSRRIAAMMCWYRAAMAVLDQTMIAITVRSGICSSNSTVAAVCRASCSRRSGTPARFSSRFHSV